MDCVRPAPCASCPWGSHPCARARIVVRVGVIFLIPVPLDDLHIHLIHSTITNTITSTRTVVSRFGLARPAWAHSLLPLSFFLGLSALVPIFVPLLAHAHLPGLVRAPVQVRVRVRVCIPVHIRVRMLVGVCTSYGACTRRLGIGHPCLAWVPYLHCSHIYQTSTSTRTGTSTSTCTGMYPSTYTSRYVYYVWY